MEETKALWRRLKIHTLLDLALILPTSYNDTTLSKQLTIGQSHTLKATVREHRYRGGKLQLTFWLSDFNQPLFATFFKVTPYHKQRFGVGSSHTIQGKLERYNGHLQISQPKSIGSVGRIVPKYKSLLTATQMRALIASMITKPNLLATGLHPQEVEILYQLHFPHTLEALYLQGSLRPEVVHALKCIEAFNHLSKLRGKRVDFPAKEALRGDITAFVVSLPFRLTPEQEQVIAQIQIDLARTDRAAKRMVVGDVGSGKTMVILASVMMAYPSRSILMAPTSLLALQLYEEACKYLPPSLRIALVMQGRSEGVYQEADFIIGTHALLYKEDIPSSALVMVDEQHRFGTKQRQMLESMMGGVEYKPHFLQFSATPIPRTQAMMESELLDVSLITSTPFEREVLTQTIGKGEFASLLEHIKEEVAQEHQVLIVYPLVEESQEIPYQSLEESRGFWEQRFEEVFVTHGKDRHKEAVLLEFRERGKILLATTVVEVGISLPCLTLIVIVGAERLGLATLHQLRGRVGRNGLKSWCYLYSNAPVNARLTAFTQTTSGFDIAKLDLKFRDSGDILDGTIQSGQKFRWLDMGEDEAIVASAKARLKEEKQGQAPA